MTHMPWIRRARRPRVYSHRCEVPQEMGVRLDLVKVSCRSKSKATLPGIFHCPKCPQINKSLEDELGNKNYELDKKAINCEKEVKYTTNVKIVRI